MKYFTAALGSLLALTAVPPARAQIIQSAGVRFGMAKGVPGLSDEKWGPEAGAGIELGGKRVRLAVTADYVVIEKAATCCGTLTYDDKGLFGLVGPEFVLGSQEFHLWLLAQIGVGRYREVRHGTLPGVPLAPTDWHGQALANVGMNASYDLWRKLRASLSLSEIASLANARVNGSGAQPLISFGISWFARR